MTAPFDLSRYQDPLTIQRVLHSAKTIAIVGLSRNPLRASYFVGFYLRRHGYHVIPVNPRETEILGEKSYHEPRRRARPDRHRQRLPRARRAAGDRPGRGGDRRRRRCGASSRVINEEGARIAEDGGLSVVMDRCIKVEHARYVGRMHWLGFNTQRITSVRGGLQ